MKMEEVDQAVNGVENINIDEDDHEKNYRPPDIDADVRDMERRKRVEAMMASRIFKEELERIVEHHSRDGGTIFSSQNLSDIFGSGSRMKTGAIIPINDIKGPESLFYIKGEKMLRCKLAALYRLVDLHGWTQSIYNHITVRINQDQEHFLINPFGLLYHEVTASSLVKVDMQGNIVDPGSSNFSVNVAGFMLHSAIHQARPDVKCVIHMHLPSVVAVSAMKCGLLPLSQEACIIGPVSYHPFEGILVDAGERVRIAENMGPKNKVMLLRNHGFVACGETIEEAWVLAYHTVLACEAQMKMLPIGIDNLITISEEAIQRTAEAVRAGVASKGESADIQATSISQSVDESDHSLRDESGAQKSGKREKKWRVGEMEFEAYMRMLDNAGYRTGYMYRQPVVKNEVPRQKLDIEVPPSVSSFGYQIEGEEAYRDLIKKLLEGKKSSERAKWINSPNVYQKVEVLETGTQDPKKITKWVADSSPTHSTPVKVDPALQFVPVGTNPKEFKLKQKAIKENRRAGGISAGPQSHILEGVSWEEMKKMQEAQTNGDQVVIVGAASKGIIQRDFQHHALVYKTPYAKNPFDNISNEEIDSYKKEIEKNMRGDLTIEEYPEYQQEQEDSFVSTNLSSIATPHQLTAESVTLPDTPHPEDVTLSPPQSPPPAASDLEDEGLSSTSSHQVLTVEANTLPRPSRAEKQLLPDHGSGMPTPHVERSKSARFPRDQVPGTQTLNRFFKRRSLSLSRDTKRNKDTVNGDDVDNPQSVSSSRDNSAGHDISEGSPVVGKKKKKSGLSFLKMKSNKKKEAAVAQ
ncbi:protein hu-li tai shao-like isoform X4 [Artemia franciscana]|uniref:protein hu-li tai shao-like isoform X4 n=1 Tax=Artemia franciscana TaxID=6661 RepID=UPI0032D9E279